MNYLDLLPDGVLIVNRYGTVAFTNRATLDLLDVGADRVVGAQCREIFRQMAAPCGREDLICPDETIAGRGGLIPPA